jgi:hypothetical protein
LEIRPSPASFETPFACRPLVKKAFGKSPRSCGDAGRKMTCGDPFGTWENPVINVDLMGFAYETW